MIPGRVRAAALVLPMLAGCGGTPDPSGGNAGEPAALTVVQGGTQLVPAGGAAPEQPVVRVTDDAGRPLQGITVVFSAGEDGGWVTHSHAVTDAAGTAATSWYAGPRAGAAYHLTASAGTLSAEFAMRTVPLVVGREVPGSNGHVVFLPGNLPFIISVPHGGELEPEDLPDRSGTVTTVRDAHTAELAREIAAAFQRRTGGQPSLVLSMLHRRKLDPNREIGEAARSHPAAERAWREYHGFIEAARAAVVASGGPGLYIDLHGHGHDIQRVELGYMLRARELSLSDATLDSPPVVARSSLRALVAAGAASHAELLRGSSSLGALLERRGFPAIPSTSQPDPGFEPYFSGGYSTGRHASQPGENIAGLQLEANLQGVRDTARNRRAFADALVDALLEYVAAWQVAPAQAPLAAVGGR